MNEDELIVAAKEGNASAFEKLLNVYRPLLVSISKRFYFPGKDKDDVLQEARIGFFRAIKSFDPQHGTAFGSFASLIVGRHLATALTASRRQKHIALTQALSLDARLSDVGEQRSSTLEDVLPDRAAPSAADIVIEQELTQKVREALVCSAGLSKMETRVMILYMRGYSYNQIAAVTGKTHRSTDNTLQRIKRKCNDAIAKVLSE